MASAKEIVDLLISTTNARWLGKESHFSHNIIGVNSNTEAQPGDLAWLSVKKASQHPESVMQFNGSLLIAPDNTEPHGKPVLACHKPKLAFIMAVDHFFADRTNIMWPTEGENVSSNARIGKNVQLAPGVVIGSQVLIDDDVIIGPNTIIANCQIRKGTRIGANCSIGLPGFGFEKDEDGVYHRFPHIGGIIIHQNVEIGSNTCIDRGSIGNTIIGSGVKIDNLVHIAHNVVIGPNSLIIANTMIGGSVTIDENVWVAPSVSVMNQINIGHSAVLGLGAVVLKDVDEMTVMVGNPAKLLRKEVGHV